MALYAIDQEKTIAHRVEKTERNPIDAQSENEDLKDSCKLYEPIYANVTSTKDDIKNDINALKVTSEPTMSDVQYSGNPIGIATESTTPNVCSSTTNLNSMERDHLDSNSISSFEDESYYQVPKSREPLYQVPKLQKPIPVYENIKMFFMGRGDEYTPVSVPMNLQPPKEKPPPPPIMDAADSNNADSDNVDSDNVETGSMGGSSTNTYDTLPHSVVDISPTGQSDMRFNSTKRIKKELRNKRFSFLGIEGCDDNYVEQNVVPPPDMIQILQEERRLEKQLYIKAGLYDNSDAGESRDSGVSENHSRQSSEPFTNSSDEPDQHEELFSIHAALMSRNSDHETLHMPQNRINMISDIEEANAKMQCIEDQIREQEEVLRVERELLQLEQEELKRQRDNLMLRENVARRELQHGAKMLMSVNHRSLQDLNATTNDSNNNNNIYANIHNQQIYQIDADYCRSTSDLQDFRRSKLNPIPPIKPSRSQVVSEEHIPMRTSHPNLHISTSSHGNMSRSTLHAISAAPKPKYNDAWLYPKKDYIENNAENWRMPYQQKRQSVPDAFNLTKTNEADPRRNQPNPVMRNNTDWTRSVSGSNISVVPNLKTGTNEGKHLPDTVIQTLTRRLQNKNIMDRKRLEEPQPIVPTLQMLPPQNIMQNSSSSRLIEKSVPHQQDKVLSVSGKKKCSHCGDELGRGAAMIIESLELFYHINCFKCCVCHLQLSDGRNGTDVRVRNHKLHCQNCYSSDDGIKFSCV